MLLAILFPGISLLLNRRQGLGILFLLLQPTLLGWLVGALVARQNLQRQRRRYRRRVEHNTQSNEEWAARLAEAAAQKQAPAWTDVH